MRTLRVVLVGAVVVALLGGLVGAVMAQDESDTGFPTGAFVSVENGYVLLEFDEDGTGFYRFVSHDWGAGHTHATDASLTYAVDGDRYTETSSDVPADMAVEDPPTYRWDYDGERLAFVELVGGDELTRQSYAYQENTYRPIEDPRIVVVAATDIDAGTPVPGWKMRPEFVPAAELGVRLYLDPEEFVGGEPLAPIAKGQPITPALVLPAE